MFPYNKLHRLLVFIPVALLLLSCGEEPPPELTPEPVSPEDTAFVSIPGGTFVTSLGDTVEIPGFQMLKYEVTNRLYLDLAERAGVGLPPDPGFPGLEHYLYERGEYPVVNVSPEEAFETATVMGCRLPTLAEWEYAASLGLTITASRGLSIYPWGILDPVDAMNPANHLYRDSWEERDGDGYPWTAPVGSYPLTDHGIADLAGNVAEMVTIPGDPVHFAVCGGSYTSTSEELLIDHHSWIYAGDRARHIGMRFVRAVPGGS